MEPFTATAGAGVFALEEISDTTAVLAGLGPPSDVTALGAVARDVDVDVVARGVGTVPSDIAALGGATTAATVLMGIGWVPNMGRRKRARGWYERKGKGWKGCGLEK